MSLLSYNELKPGTVFIKEGQPYEVVDYSFVRMQQRKPVVQLKIKNLISKKLLDYTAHQTDSFEEALIDRVSIKFLYGNRGEYWFSDPDNPKNRFQLKEEQISDIVGYLKANQLLEAFKLGEMIIKIQLPVKMEFKVTEAPPAIKGDTAQGGTKSVTIETGAKVNVPLFISEGDVVRINTQSGEYVERVTKA